MLANPSFYEAYVNKFTEVEKHNFKEGMIFVTKATGVVLWETAKMVSWHLFKTWAVYKLSQQIDKFMTGGSQFMTGRALTAARLPLEVSSYRQDAIRIGLRIQAISPPAYR